MDLIRELLPLVLPLIVIQVAFQIYCLVNLSKRRKVRYGNKWLWAVVIIALSLAGPIIYLLGRGEEE